MADSIRGMYPGGPSRGDGGKGAPSRAPRLERMEELEGRRVALGLRMRIRRRRRQMVWTGVVALAAAALIGYAMGAASGSSPAELAAEREVEARSSELSEQVNRTLLELWRMEDVEALRNTGRIR